LDQLEAIKDKLEEYRMKFPEHVYVFSNEEIGKFKTADMFKFKTMRKVFMREWKLLKSIDFDTSTNGNKDSPFDLSHLKISLKHLEMVCAMASLNSKDYENIGNLTKDMI